MIIIHQKRKNPTLTITNRKADMRRKKQKNSNDLFPNNLEFIKGLQYIHMIPIHIY